MNPEDRKETEEIVAKAVAAAQVRADLDATRAIAAAREALRKEITSSRAQAYGTLALLAVILGVIGHNAITWQVDNYVQKVGQQKFGDRLTALESEAKKRMDSLNSTLDAVRDTAREAEEFKSLLTSPVNTGQAEVVRLLPHKGYWGKWTEDKMAPPNHYVAGIRVRMEPPQKGDDTALNAVELICLPFQQKPKELKPPEQ